MAEEPRLAVESIAGQRPYQEDSVIAQNLSDGRLLIANAGHCPVAIVRAAGGVDLVTAHGPVLGLLPAGSWPQEELKLAPGDTMVFYSDGISESFSPSGEELGVQGAESFRDGGGESLTLVGAVEELIGRSLDIGPADLAAVRSVAAHSDAKPEAL